MIEMIDLTMLVDEEERLVIDLTEEPEVEVVSASSYRSKQIPPRWHMGYDELRGLYAIPPPEFMPAPRKRILPPRKRHVERKRVRALDEESSESELEDEDIKGLVNWLENDVPVYDYHQNFPFFNEKEWPYSDSSV